MSNVLAARIQADPINDNLVYPIKTLDPRILLNARITCIKRFSFPSLGPQDESRQTQFHFYILMHNMYFPL